VSRLVLQQLSDAELKLFVERVSPESIGIACRIAPEDLDARVRAAMSDPAAVAAFDQARGIRRKAAEVDAAIAVLDAATEQLARAGKIRHIEPEELELI
jgi:hypothetical protein